METLYLVDVSAMYFRAYYAIRPLSNSSGLPTNALFGFLNMSSKLLNEQKPKYIAYCFDTKEKNFRYEMYSEYKANRSEMPEDLIPQVPYVAKLVNALGLPAFEKIGLEADDIIGILQKYAQEQNLNVVIVSGDKDFAQFVNDRVKLYDPMKEQWFDRAAVVEKWGVEPEQIVDYLSMVGDSSDNIPGISGIGPKGAQKLLQEFGSLENVYNNLEKISNLKLREKLLNSKEMAFLSKKLVQIVTDNRIGIQSLDAVTKQQIKTSELLSLLEELEFKNFAKRLLQADEAFSKNQDHSQRQSKPDKSSAFDVSEKTETSMLDDKSGLAKSVASEQNALNLDKAKTNTDITNSKIKSVNEGLNVPNFAPVKKNANTNMESSAIGSLSNSSKQNAERFPTQNDFSNSNVGDLKLASITVSDDSLHANTQMGLFSDEKAKATRFLKNNKSAEFLQLQYSVATEESLMHFLNSNHEIWSFQYEEQVYVASDLQILKILDSDIASFANSFAKHPVVWKGHDLKNVWRQLSLSAQKLSWDSMIAMYVLTAKNVGDISEIFLQYFMSDADLLMKTEEDNSPEIVKNLYLAQNEIQKKMQAEIKEKSLEKIFYEIEMPVVGILRQMEERGVYIDAATLHIQEQEIQRDLQKLSKEIFLATNSEFNIDSPKQLSQILFEKMKLPIIKKTKTSISTDSEVLEKLAVNYPFCNKIIEYRELKKLLGTYVEALPRLIDEKTGRVHSHWNQAVTATGRLSSTNPNLQNIPIRTERGNDVRKAFIAPDNKVLLSADYSQIELRILAHISNDPGLIKAFQQDLDIHTATASEVFSVELSEVDSDMRRKAKAINFGIAYGMGAFSLAENLGISRAEAKEIIDRYFTKFAGVKNYMTEAVVNANRQRFSESIMGRRRYIPELFSKAPAIKAFGERIAINSPMQSSASDIVKKAMIDLNQIKNAELIMQVHDELVFEVAEEYIEEVMQEVKFKMENVVQLQIPLKVNLAFSKNWREAH